MGCGPAIFKSSLTWLTIKCQFWCTHALQIIFSGIKINVESRAYTSEAFSSILFKYRLQSAHFIRQVEEPKFVNSWHLAGIVREAWHELLNWNLSQITSKGRFYQFSLLLIESTSDIQHQRLEANIKCHAQTV